MFGKICGNNQTINQGLNVWKLWPKHGVSSMEKQLRSLWKCGCWTNIRSVYFYKNMKTFIIK